nr:transglutaminase-like cysteine peptidase [Thauera phenolivorans]
MRPPPPRRFLTALRRLAGALCVGACAAARAMPDAGDVERLTQARHDAMGASRVADWRRLIAEAGGLSAGERLERVNTFLNRQLRFDDDKVIWRQPDYWATPIETLGLGAGDCEDFAIAKYVSLRLLGIPAAQLRLIYVRARIGGPRSGHSQAHMVVGYFPAPGAEPLLLDNLIGEIRPASRRPDLFPVFSFNGEGLWVGGEVAADPSARLSRWRDVLDRMQREGLQFNP